MKKLIALVSAVSAAATGSALADVSVSGGMQSYYVSGDGTATRTAVNDAEVAQISGSIAFAMSTETANGVSVTAGASITRHSTSQLWTASGAGGVAGGMSALTFGMDGMTVTIGDIDNSGSGAGDGGDVSTIASVGAGDFYTAPTAPALRVGNSATDGIADGMGVQLSTALTDNANISLSFVPSASADTTTYIDNDNSDNKVDGMGVGITTTVGGMAVDLGFAANTNNTTGTKDDSAFGLDVTYAASDALSITAGAFGGSVTAVDHDGAFVTAAYTMDADTTLSLGWARADSKNSSGATSNGTTISVNVSRSLGGGMSVFAEYADLSTSGSESGNAFAVGTKVSF